MIGAERFCHALARSEIRESILSAPQERIRIELGPVFQTQFLRKGQL